jgi:hypothetical protein
VPSSKVVVPPLSPPQSNSGYLGLSRGVVARTAELQRWWSPLSNVVCARGRASDRMASGELYAKSKRWRPADMYNSRTLLSKRPRRWRRWSLIMTLSLGVVVFARKIDALRRLTFAATLVNLSPQQDLWSPCGSPG